AHYSLEVCHHRAGIVLAKIVGGTLDLVRGGMHGIGCSRGNAFAATMQRRRSAFELARRAYAPFINLVAGFSTEIRHRLFYLGGFLPDLLFYFARVACRVSSLCVHCLFCVPCSVL